MAEQKSSEERIAELDKRIEQIKAQKKAIIQREKQVERKARTKRLIEIGGAAESVLGRPFQDGDLQKFINFLKQQEVRGNYYSKAMNSSTDKSKKFPIHPSYVIEVNYCQQLYHNNFDTVVDKLPDS